MPHWFPYQLRHGHATAVRRRFGLEAAQCVLGHAKADVTEVYAQKHAPLAARVAAEVGCLRAARPGVGSGSAPL